MFLIRLFLLPFKLVFGLVRLVFRIAFRLGTIPARASGITLRVVGIRGWLFLVIGVAIGALLTPFTGRELRLKLQAMISGGAESGTTLADKVAFELAHAPRTWHLTQPAITVRAGEVVLEGVVSDDDARDELGRVAAAIPGVDRVDNRLEVAGDAPVAG